jgi:hypothetical protein
MQNQRPALMLANGMVYVGYASHCDKEPYHGFLMAYDAKTLKQIGVVGHLAEAKADGALNDRSCGLIGFDIGNR